MLWGTLFGSAFFLIPGIGPLVMAGPLVTWIVAALEGAAVVGGLSAVGAALYSLDIPEDSILQYETALKAGKFVLIAHGSAHDVAHARVVLARTATEPSGSTADLDLDALPSGSPAGEALVGAR